MVDIPGNSSTGSSIAVGGTVTGSLETEGDHDWFRVTLTAGQQISVTMTGSGANPLEDPYLRIRDSSGNVIFENDDGGPGRNSMVAFQASYSGVYYIDASAWVPDSPLADYSTAGDYQLAVAYYTPPPVWTNDQIAEQLVSGYWDGSVHRFNVAPGGSLTVNMVGLTAAGQALARNALNVWSDVIGVTFREVTAGGQIVFDDPEEGASSGADYTNGFISSADVNVSTQWLTDYGTGLNSYSAQTYIHEVGHALGLGHAGNYNETADYPYSALFANDAWPTSVMSYFSPDENSYFSSRNYTDNFVATPMVADVLAMARLYGLSTTTRAGNTVYGFNSTADRAIYDAAQFPALSFAIVDSGGVDTIDYSRYGGTQLIDLRTEQFSNVNGRTGNLTIARGVVIENSIGGNGNDTIYGNDVANLLIGSGGADQIFAGNGDDQVDGGSANDIPDGGQGNDVLVGREGDDLLIGSGGADLLIGEGGSDRIDGGQGADTLNGGEGDDILVGREDDDLLLGSGGADLLYGSDGADRIDGGLGKDFLDGGEGNDILVGREDDDVLLGSGGNDYLAGSDGRDLIDGGSGNDVLDGGAGDDVLNGGGGVDALTGGAGIDWFAFREIGASVTITDFLQGVDLLDFSSMDANILAAGDQAFSFIAGGAFSNVAGQLRAYVDVSSTYLAGDVDGNSVADVLIGLGSAQVAASDIWL